MSQILTAATANDDTSNTFAIDPEKGLSLQIDGTWDTATLTLQGSLDGGTTWTDVEAYTADVFKKLSGSNEADYRLLLSSVGASTSLNAWVG